MDKEEEKAYHREYMQKYRKTNAKYIAYKNNYDKQYYEANKGKSISCF